MICDNVVLYGRGAASVGEQIGKSYDEAQQIIDSFFKSFPKVKKWIDESIDNAHKLGYVEDVAGRRRRLPDATLPPYTIKCGDGENSFNPLFESKLLYTCEDKKLIAKYEEALAKCRSFKQKEAVKEAAKQEGVTILDNGGFIAQAERQAVNSRVQGGAATLTKVALNVIYRDGRLRDIGAKLINTVHDEILMEVPEENSKLAEKYLQEDMINSAKEYVPEVPMKCDTYNVQAWYYGDMASDLQGKFTKLQKEMSREEALQKLQEEYAYFKGDRLIRLLEYED